MQCQNVLLTPLSHSLCFFYAFQTGGNNCVDYIPLLRLQQLPPTQAIKGIQKSHYSCKNLKHSQSLSLSNFSVQKLLLWVQIFVQSFCWKHLNLGFLTFNFVMLFFWCNSLIKAGKGLKPMNRLTSTVNSHIDMGWDRVLCLLSSFLFHLYLWGSNSMPLSYLITELHSAEQHTAEVTLVIEEMQTLLQKRIVMM